MHQIVFVATIAAAEELEFEESPANHFPCMSTQQIHRDARAQLYCTVTGDFLDESFSKEELFKSFGDEGPYIYALDRHLMTQLARLDEDDLIRVAQHWATCAEIEQLALDTQDLVDFLEQYVHFCQIASNDDMTFFLYSDD